MSKVSGHSGLPEDVEIRMMVEKAEKNKARQEQRFRDQLEFLRKLGIAPSEMRSFIISFVKWMEGQK